MSQVKSIDEKYFNTNVLNSTKPVLLDFYTEWCGPCKMLSPVIDIVAENLSDEINFYKINTDENQQLAIDYKITTLPCLIIINKGQEIDRKTGYQKENKLTDWLKIQNHLY